MLIIVDNVQSLCVIGGKDNLLPYNLLETLREYLRLQPEDYFRVPAYNKFDKDGNRLWDGWRYFINKRGAFPTGLLRILLKFVKEELPEVDVILQDKRGYIPKLIEESDDFLGNILDEKKAQYVPWYIRDYQKEACLKCFPTVDTGFGQLYFPRGIADAATNTGKNSIMTWLAKNIEGARCIMLIHNTSIFNQAYKFFKQCFDSVGRIDSKHYELGQFTVAMQRTLYNRLESSLNVKKDMAKFNVLFVDEGHRMGDGQYLKTVNAIPAPIRFLVSGTPLDSTNQVNNFLRVGAFGKTLFKITNDDLINHGVSLAPKVHVLLNKSGAGLYFSYSEEAIAVIKTSKGRMQLLNDFLVDTGRIDKYIAVAFNDIAHGELIYECFKEDSRFDHLRIELTHGQDPQREYKLNEYLKGNINILIGSTIMQEGLNLPVMQVLVYAIAGLSKIRLKQFVGRLTRDDGVSDHVDIIEFYDMGRWVSEHSRTRLKRYAEEGFEINYYYPNKNGKPTDLRMNARGFAMK